MKEKTDSPEALMRDRRATAVSAPLALRLSVYLTRARLDRQIKSGLPWHATAELALRARQLIDPRTRQRLASGLRGTVEWVDWIGSRPSFSAVMIERYGVRAGREALLGLAERLDGPDPVCPRGIVLAQILLTDGCVSPLFSRHCERTVVEAVWEVADALEVGDQTVEYLYS